MERIEAFLAAHGSPQNSIKALHVGGTNGKGSTVAILDAILRAGKLKVARFTGPHLLRWNERFHLDGQAIDDDEFAKRAMHLRDLSIRFGAENPELGPLTWFEFLTALAFFYFVEEQADIAVFEVGVGGRFDATNVISRPLAVGITNISLDHTHILGTTIEKIAFEKAGIIKAKSPVVTGATSPAREVIEARAQELEAPFFYCSDETPAQRAHELANQSGAWSNVLSIAASSPLRGAYQRPNTMIALEMLRSAGLFEAGARLGQLTPAAVGQGLKNVYWPGRFQFVDGIILDGAHNVAGAEALRSSLDELFPNENFHFVFSCYANKDGAHMLTSLIRPGDRLFASQAELPRAVFPMEELAACARELGIEASVHDSIELAFEEAQKASKGLRRVVVAGSFATVKAVVKKLGWQKVEDGLVKC